MSVKLTLAQIAERFQLGLLGDGLIVIDGVNTLRDALPTQISFLANPKYASQLAGTRAGAVVLSQAAQPACQAAALVSSNPYADFARIAALFARDTRPAAGIAPSAVIEPGARLGANVSIGAHCSIASTAVLADDVVLHAGCIVGPDCVIAAGCVLMPRVTLVKRVQLGARSIVHSGAVLGADGFGLAPVPDGWLKIPQLGGVMIGEDCEIGANTTIDCGALGDTVLGRAVKLDNQIQIGHNVTIGDLTAIAGCTAIAGSTRIGARCLIAGGVGFAGHLTICDGVRLSAMTLVTHDIHEPGEYAGAMPMMPAKEWRRNAVQIRRLDAQLRKRGD
jgi:UDP-3-O-[3-hydroxymyristoyl] glucosamine N-acyltransferase